jgi:hypothetical protein
VVVLLSDSQSAGDVTNEQGWHADPRRKLFGLCRLRYSVGTRSYSPLPSRLTSLRDYNRNIAYRRPTFMSTPKVGTLSGQQLMRWSRVVMGDRKYVLVHPDPPDHNTGALTGTLHPLLITLPTLFFQCTGTVLRDWMESASAFCPGSTPITSGLVE